MTRRSKITLPKLAAQPPREIRELFSDAGLDEGGGEFQVSGANLLGEVWAAFGELRGLSV
jgi:hypothetical protein